jgi:parvulin-like peptidyl-prolyl isomerase
MQIWMLMALCGTLLAAEGSGMVVDRSVRFVNDQVVTIGDIRSRNGIRIELFRRAGRVLPDNRDSLLRFNRDTLEELTDEELLVQKANELQVAIDRDRLSSEVIAEARTRGLALRDIAVLRRTRDRDAKIDAVIGWFEGRAANITPTDLRATYDRRIADFARPPRARTLLIALRPTADDERKELVKSLAGLMREAQQSGDEAITAAAAGQLDAFLAADTPGQEAILATVAGEVAKHAGRDGLPKKAIALTQRAGELITRWRAVRTREQCLAELNALREELMRLEASARAELFNARAKAISQGPQASEGGLLGWVEPSTFGKEIEEQALAMPVGEPSAPFWTGGAAAVVLVLEREEGRTQSFAEVVATLQAALERERRQQVRRRVTDVLRAQASIHDVVDLGELLQ